MAKNNQQYWADRLNDIAQHRFDTTNEAMQKELKALYDEVATKMQDKVEDLYYKLLEEGNLKRSEIWTYKHYRDLEKQINAEMVKLGNKEVKLLNGNLEWALEEIYKDTGIIPYADKFALLSQSMVKAIVNRPWAAQHFTSTVWKNKELLAQQLKKGVAECIITGKSKDKLVESVMKKMNTGFNNADRVVRTELMHTINQGQVQRYKDTGYTKLVWNTAFDSRTCDDCAHLDGTVVGIDSTDIPPVHARCRCTICPLLDSLTPKLTVQETGTINTYIGGDSYKINELLRTGAVLTPFYKEVITNLDSALSKMPCYSGDLSRSLQFNDDEALKDFLEKHEVGNKVMYPAYTSTTFGDTYNPDGQVQILIDKSSKGRDISYFNQGELEVLYERNTKFEVIGTVEESGRHIIYLKEI